MCNITKSKYGKALALSLILVLCIIMTCKSTPVNATALQILQSDLALNKTATASSIEGSGFEAAKAFDGNTATRWASLEGTDPQWITVDLGSNMNVSSVKLLWEAAYAKSYKIQISTDNSQWIDVYSTTNGDGGEDLISFEQKNTRYVRMYGTQRGTTYGYSLYSFEVYGANSQNPQNDLALSKTATASSIEGSGLEASKAFDGNTATRWASLAGTDPQWISVDLGSNANISSVKLLWEAAYAKSYKIQISTDNSQWLDVYSTTSGNGGEDLISFEQKSTRYVRMYGTQRGTSYGYSLYSFEVYGTDGQNPQVPAVPTGLSAAAAGTSRINISWAASLGATGYDLDVDGAIVYDVSSPYAHTGLALGSTHTYKVRAKNVSGTSSWSSPVSTTTESGTGGINMPFPQQVSYTGCIKPNNVTQTQMNNTIKSYYDYWKSAYIRESNGATPGGGYYVEMKGTGGTGNEITTSEAHGYGMLIFTMMAGYDSQAKTYFDGMYNMYNKHRSKGDSDLMSWLIDKSELTSMDSNSATDGDMDIAYALLMAHKQWGSNGTINYLSEARRIITNGIKTSDMSQSSKRTMLGDWDTDPLSTRSSDWMTGHFHTFFNATNDTFWNDAANTAYGLITQITNNYSNSTGLMPDFVVDNPAKPAPPYFLEADTDDDYSWNACRYPWRIAMDYAHYGNTDSKNACNKVLSWVKSKTGNNPSNIMAGYKLNGDPLVSYTSAAFTAPFIAACVVDSSHQDYLNAGWSRISNLKEGYYGDSINLLCMLFISGNWWKPSGF